jgi:hypothetical protein
LYFYHLVVNHLLYTYLLLFWNWPYIPVYANPDILVYIQVDQVGWTAYMRISRDQVWYATNTRLIQVGSHPLGSTAARGWSDTICEHIETPVSGPEPATGTVISTEDRHVIVEWNPTVIWARTTESMKPVCLKGILVTACGFCS